MDDTEQHAPDSDVGLFDGKLIGLLNSHQIGESHDLPERNLILAIFRQALADIREGRSNSLDALLFFSLRNPDFRWYCDLLAVSPELIIDTFKSYISKINSRARRGRSCNVRLAII